MSEEDKIIQDTDGYALRDVETAADYGVYCERVRDFLEREGLDTLSTTPNVNGYEESYFTWWPCDCCRRPLGSDQYTCSGYNPATREVQEGYEVCVDCVYYIEYGQLDDSTMWCIRKDEERQQREAPID